VNATLRASPRRASRHWPIRLMAASAAVLLSVGAADRAGVPAHAQDSAGAGWAGSLEPLPPDTRPAAAAPVRSGPAARPAMDGARTLPGGFDPLPPMTAARSQAVPFDPVSRGAASPRIGAFQRSTGSSTAATSNTPAPLHGAGTAAAAARPSAVPSTATPAATSPGSVTVKPATTSAVTAVPSVGRIDTIPAPVRRAPAATRPGSAAVAGPSTPLPRVRPDNAASAPSGADTAPPREYIAEGVYRRGNTIVATVGRAVRFETERTVGSIVIGDEETVDSILADPKTIYLVGAQPGRTNVFIRGTDGDVLEQYDMVIEADMAALREALRAVVPDSRISVTATQSGLILNGQVRSAAESANAARVAKQFVGGEGAIVNAIRIAGDQQVLLRVRVAEMNRSARKFLEGTSQRYSDVRTPGTGDNILGASASDLSPDLSTLVEDVAISTLTGGAGQFGTIFLNQAGFDEITFETLEERSLARLLAEPTLTAISGETANFLAGGEFPIATGEDDNGNPIVEFKEFGVKLSFTPVVLSRNQISLRINTEVSRLDEEASDILGVPGLSTRRAESTIMLPSGGSLMIAGLLQSEDRNTLNGTPGLMDLPILGALFRSQDFQNDRSELVITVEAFTVRPRQMGPALALPTDGFKPADDFDMYVLGRLHDRYGVLEGLGRQTPAMTVDAPFGYIME